PGAEGDVASAWRELLADRAWVRLREEAIDQGWFGPDIGDRVRDAIGEVVVALRGTSVVTHRAVDPLQAGPRGHHGSLTSAEILVPLVVAGPGVAPPAASLPPRGCRPPGPRRTARRGEGGGGHVASGRRTPRVGSRHSRGWRGAPSATG